MIGMGDVAQIDTGFEGYPPDYVIHNLPLIVLSGLCPTPPTDDSTHFPHVLDDTGSAIESELPVATGERAEQLLQEFRSCEKSDQQWNNKPVPGKSALMGFKFRVVGRDFTLPPRKAAPPEGSLGLEPPGSPGSKLQPHWVLHSPISPLSPGSPLFPDGVMTPLWIAKHQRFVPSVFISFFDFTSDHARNSLLDNQLKSEISSIKAALYRSEYKTRYVVVLLSDKTIFEAPEIEERLANIRRATGLDAKNGFFFLPPNTSRVEVASFVESILSALQPICVEYYRDLTKHARRKKNRGNIPPPTAPPTRGTSQTLAALGWGVRYDFKLGVLAEFRQEMEAACRHYISALDALLGPDGIFETTASWSPRWDEARLLADTVAFRVIRCLLWSNMPTTAAQSWTNYRDRFRELVDRRGKGSANYGWEAWESRWARVMAELVRRAELPAFPVDSALDESSSNSKREFQIYAPIEKAFPVGERVPPWHYLHHPAYWWRQAAKHAWRRRRRAQDLPEEDRMPPGQSPASAMATRFGTYDTYLCPEPHFEMPLPGRPGYDHSKDILSALDKATNYLRVQPRAADEVTFDMSKELMRTKQNVEAMNPLFHLWEQMAWRRDQWWRLVYEVTRSLHECAKLVGDAKVVAATEFELYSNVLPLARNHQYDLMRCSSTLHQSNSSKFSGPAVELSAEKVTSFLSTALNFSAEEGNAGEPLVAQLSITSRAHKGSAPVILNEINVQLEGYASRINITHQEDNAGSAKAHLRKLTLQEDSPSKSASSLSFTGVSDLTIHSGQVIVLEFPLTFREAGPVTVREIMLSISTDHFTLNYLSKPQHEGYPAFWWLQGPSGLRTRRIGREESSKVQILPRPPKMELRLPNIEKRFYTDENINIDIEVINLEDEETEATLEVRLLTREGPEEFAWVSSSDSNEEDTSLHPVSSLPGHHIGNLKQGESKTETIAFTAPTLPSEYVVEARVLYHLLSDRETPVSRAYSANLNITRAFEANYDLDPRIHPDPWPSFFGPSSIPIEEAEKTAKGITQRWQLSARIASFAYEGLIIQDVSLVQDSVTGGAIVKDCRGGNPEVEGDTEIAPEQQISRSFTLDITKPSLEDRRSTSLDMSLSITWRRPESNSPSVTSQIPVTQYTLPNSEPRVMASILKSSPAANPAATSLPRSFTQLVYTLENPTTHFLTFDLEMTLSDDFAFSGPKARSLNLLPMSRESIGFQILPLGGGGGDAEAEADGAAHGGAWIEVRYKVVDRYFKKVLRILPASEGVREGKGGVVGIWIDTREE